MITERSLRIWSVLLPYRSIVNVRCDEVLVVRFVLAGENRDDDIVSYRDRVAEVVRIGDVTPLLAPIGFIICGTVEEDSTVSDKRFVEVALADLPVKRTIV